MILFSLPEHRMESINITDAMETAMLIALFPLAILLVVFYQMLLRGFVRHLHRRLERSLTVSGSVTAVARMQSKTAHEDVIYRIDYRHQNSDYSIQQHFHGAGTTANTSLSLNQQVNLRVPLRHPDRGVIARDSDEFGNLFLFGFPAITLGLFVVINWLIANA